MPVAERKMQEDQRFEAITGYLRPGLRKQNATARKSLVCEEFKHVLQVIL